MLCSRIRPLCLLVVLALLILPSACKDLPVLGEVFQLDDWNFDTHINSSSTWMIAISASWCPACRDLEPVWKALAQELKDDDIFVAKIDAKQRGLLRRFNVKAFPSIYHIHNRELRDYRGRDRSLRELASFARINWKAEEPIRGCSNPVSPCGRAMGEVTKLPHRLKKTYIDLRNTKQYSDVALVFMGLMIPVTFGLMTIAAADYLLSRRPLD